MAGQGKPSAHVSVRIQRADFCVAQEEAALVAASAGVGATVAFTGWVRNHNEGDAVTGLFLEHYPGMTERTITNIVEQAVPRWGLLAVTVVHRVGQLPVGDHIVYVGVAAAHRGAAFAGAEFIMDYLKTQAPFWKKETSAAGERWLDARDTDQSAAQRWSP